VGQDQLREGGSVAVITKLVKGFDPDYPFKQQGRWAGDYFDEKGEPLGRWWGSGAAALGLAPGSEINRETHKKVIADHLDPRTGARLGRSPGNAAARAEALYQAKLEAEPHATLKRQFELRREAAKEARQGPVYLELDNSFSKSFSVWYASIGENARSARLAGDEGERAWWSGLLREIDEMKPTRPAWTTSSVRPGTRGRATTGAGSTARRRGSSTRPGW
jgi:hypothetical protein